MHDRMNDVIRVVQLWESYLPTFTGAAIRHNHLAPLMNALAVSITVLTPQRDNASSREVINGVNVSRIPMVFTKNKILQQVSVGMLLCYELIARRRCYDVVHSMSQNPFHIPAFFVAKLLGKPVMLDFTLLESNQQSSKSKIYNRIAYAIFRYLDAHIGISTPLIQQMIQRGLPASKCYLIPVGVYTDQFAPLEAEKRMALRNELGLMREALYLVFVGSFLERKGVDILIEMMMHLRQSHPHIHLIIAGKHEFSERYSKSARDFILLWKKRICEYGLEDRIHLTGEVGYQEVLRWLQAGDIFVFPSRREGFGRVIVEAMAVGLPCVCSELDGVVYDIISPEIDGIVIRENTAEKLAEQVVRLAGDKDLCCRLGSNARGTTVSRFNEIQFADAYRGLYDEVLGSKQMSENLTNEFGCIANNPER